MSMPLDAFEFDYERSRAAVAVACLRWLNCTGPAIEPGVGRDGVDEFRVDPPPTEGPDLADPMDWPHPLWDRWIDGGESR